MAQRLLKQQQNLVYDTKVILVNYRRDDILKGEGYNQYNETWCK